MSAAILFWFQIVMAWVYMVPQVIGLLSGKTAGLTLAMWLIFIGYLGVSLSLAFMSLKEKRETLRLYTVIIFAQWTVFISVLFLLALPSVRWNPGDTVVCIAVLGLSALTVLINRSLKDPMTRGWLAVWCKGIPQLWMAYFMWSSGSADWLPGLSLLATDATCIPRLIQVYLQGLRGGWDRATKALFLGELSNVASWAVVNIVWVTLNYF